MGIGWSGGLLVAAISPTGGGKEGGASKEEETLGGEGCFVAAETAIRSVAAAGFGARAVRLDDDVQTLGQMAFAHDFLHLHDCDVRLGFLRRFSYAAHFFALFYRRFFEVVAAG